MTGASMSASWVTNALTTRNQVRKGRPERVGSALIAWMKVMLATSARKCATMQIW
jgi:hypothetical protein